MVSPVEMFWTTGSCKLCPERLYHCKPGPEKNVGQLKCKATHGYIMFLTLTCDKLDATASDIDCTVNPDSGVVLSLLVEALLKCPQQYGPRLSASPTPLPSKGALVTPKIGLILIWIPVLPTPGSCTRAFQTTWSLQTSNLQGTLSGSRLWWDSTEASLCL